MRIFILLSLVYLVSAKKYNFDNLENSISEHDEVNSKKFNPDWKDLDTRKLPEWYDRAKIGIFLHWGVYSVPSYGSEWFWSNWKGGSLKYTLFMDKNYPPGFTYQEFAPMFTAEFFDPQQWAQLFSKAGAKYIVLTSKHHEGFTLFPSKRSFSWNAVEVGPKHDLVKDLSEAVRAEGVLLHHKWENAFTVDKQSWGYRRTMKLDEILSMNELLEQVVTTVSCGGNALINIGPTKEGTIAPIFQERLLSLGEWLTVNGEAIYNSSPWISQNDTSNGNVWYTCQRVNYNAEKPTAKAKKSDAIRAIYAIVLKWPNVDLLRLADVTSYLHSGNYKVEMLGNEGDYLDWTIVNGDVDIKLPNKASTKSEYAWVLKFTLK